MSTKFPNKKPEQVIKIGHYNWEIFIGGKEVNTHLNSDDYHGQCIESLQKILIATIDSDGTPLNKQMILDTYVHEVLHAFSYTYGFKKLNENLIIKITPLICDLIMENAKYIYRIFDIEEHN